MNEQQKKIVDLSQLREITGKDTEVERAIFESFYKSTEENITLMEANCIDAESEEYKRNAHSIKGASKSIGATTLGELSSQAQDSYNKDAKTKKQLVEKIKLEYEKVKEFLKNAENLK